MLVLQYHLYSLQKGVVVKELEATNAIGAQSQVYSLWKAEHIKWERS